MHDDVTEITLINPKPKKSPSLWMNMATLILLFCLVVGAKYISDRWWSKSPAEEPSENHIVLEDLENETPIAESPAVVMPAEPASPEPVPIEAPPAVEQPVVERPKPASPEPALSKPTLSVPAEKMALKVRAEVRVPATDPYTDGGPLDLDRRENQTGPGILIQKVPLAGTKTAPAVAAPSSPTMDERDQVIPFESN